jgi:type IV pilus assembly protein PilY1
MFTIPRLAKTVFGAVSASLLVMTLQAQTLSQLPLLTKTATVTPNLLLILDDSGSMAAQYLYQYGGTGGGMGLPGPGGGKGQTTASCPSTLNIDTTCAYNSVAIAITSSTGTPANWSNSSTYAQNTFVLGSDNKVYQCQEPTGCVAGNNPTVVAVTPPTWTATSYNFNDKVLYSPDGHVYNCTRGSGCSSSRIPGNSSRWDDLGLLADYLDSVVQWSTPGIPLATYLAASVSAPTGTGRFWELSPDVNRITYDPRVRYRVRLTGTGSTTTPFTAPAVSSDFYVFFYGNGGTASPKISQVWDGTTTYGDPATYGSYFPQYSAVNQATNLASGLAQGATTGLSYPQCVGSCTSAPASVSNSSGQLPKFAARSDCAAAYCTLLDEWKNYSIWKKFHSNRMDLAKTGIGYAFQDVSSGLRLGWSQISDLDSSPTDLGATGAGVSALTQTNKTAFYTWLYARKPSSGTPLRDALDAAGKYFSRSDNFGPWSDAPIITSTGLSTLATTTTDTLAVRALHKTCRRSYAMLVTDGYYNGSDPGNGSVYPGTNDSDYKALTSPITGTTPSGASLSFTYDGRTKPYAQQSTTGTMADIAMKYWITDLRTDLTNNVPKSSINESFWQNMGFYAVGLGIDGTLAQTQANLNGLTAGTLTWPNPPSAGNTPATVDDLWHATINARGRTLTARNADALSDAVESMLAEINKVTDSQSGVAASTASLITGTRKYSPLYTTGTWVGNIVASNLDPTSAVDTCIAWQTTGSVITGPKVAPACSGYTSNNIPAYGSRNIVSYNGSSYGAFNSSNSYVTSNVVGGSTSSLINYLRGDQSNEDTATVTNLYRARESLLGDIVNSTPTFIKGALDAGYANLPNGTLGQAGYAAFVAAKGARTEGVLFAGANDGMLHGFRDSNGAEAFAFVPQAVMPKLHLLANRSYDHTYYVDGTTTEADACLGVANKNCTASEWKNLLLGSLGAGGKEVFALDVTALTPSATMGLGASNVLWEITTSTTGFGNLGITLQDVQTGVTTDGRWIAVFGNGYYGADGIAHLYVADLNTGALIADFNTTVGSSNGLSGATLARDSNMRIIGAYAGDLKGNVWKFNLDPSCLTSTSGTNCITRVFAPASGKPITAPPYIVAHPNGGRVVDIGTGKFFDTEDTSTTATQTFYGIWDSAAFGASMSGVTQTDTSLLQVQTVTGPTTGTYVATNANGTTYTATISGYTQSKNTIDWTTQRGWYMNVPASFTGERLIYPMANVYNIATSRLVLANTLAPSNNSDPCINVQTGSGHSYIFDGLTGARPDKDVYVGCTACSIVDTPPVPPVPICNGSQCFSLTPTEPGCTQNCSTPPIEKKCGSQTFACPSTSTKVKRTWRQIFMR